jgi:glutathione S-transferase
MIELYFAPGASSFVPHVALEIVKAASGEGFEAKIVKLHKNEQRTPEFLAMNPAAQVPVLVADGKPLAQILAIVDYLDRRFPRAGLLPSDAWARAQALSLLAWMNNTVHPCFTRWFRTYIYAESEAACAEVKRLAVADLRANLARIQAMTGQAAPFWLGAHAGPLDAYAFTLLRWSGMAGIDPDSLPGLKAYVERVMQAPPVAAALERERIRLDTYKQAA